LKIQARVACKQLGFRDAIYKTVGSSFGLVNSSAFSYDFVTCTGTESTIDNCPHSSKVVVSTCSLIHNKKPIVLFERHCHVTEKSEAIAIVPGDAGHPG
jgi:hypothetical protein